MVQPNELSPTDLPRRAGGEGRTQHRVRCRENTIVRLAIRPSFQSFPALIHDVSDTGIGFLVDRSLDPGTVLALQLNGGKPGTSLIRMARVVHVRRHLPVKNPPWRKKKPLLQTLLSILNCGGSTQKIDEDWVWLIGCHLSPPLSADELESLR